jgi:dinuclear metal center YbgI/SA1388 family protein
MLKVSDVLSALEEVAPQRFAFPSDKVGLQVGSTGSEVSRAVVSLDRSLGAASFAAEVRADLLLCHHPLIWEPLKSVTSDSYAGRVVTELIRGGINFIAAHTNWDCAEGGINDTLAKQLQLIEVKAFGEAAPVARLKLVVFAPESEAQKIIDAASGAGAGVIGLYRRCAYMSMGTGTFFSPPGTDPTVGQVGEVQEVAELRIEMVLPEALCGVVTRAIVEVHPYEEPAYDFVRLTDSQEQPISRAGKLLKSMNLSEFAKHVDEMLGTRCQAWGRPDSHIRDVAVCGGSAADEWRAARSTGADVLVTGEVPQHTALEASENGLAIIAAGHYATEHPGCRALKATMETKLPQIEWMLYEPPAGIAGRPF